MASKSDPVDQLSGLMLDRQVHEALNLLKRMSMVDVFSSHGHTIIGSASACNCLEIVRYLIEVRGTNVDFQNKAGVTPLMFASHRGNLDMVEYLLRCDANPNVRTLGGDTPLIFAIEGGNLEVVKALESKKADLHYIQPSTGFSLVKIAELECWVEIAKYLNECLSQRLRPLTGH